MMLSKPLVSLVIAFAATSSVAASTTSVRRGFNDGYPLPPNPTYVNQCNRESTVCCNAFTTAQGAGSAVAGLPDLLLDPNPNVGLTCTPILGQNQCNTNTLCCQNVTQGESLIGFQCDSINDNL